MSGFQSLCAMFLASWAHRELKFCTMVKLYLYANCHALLWMYLPVNKCYCLKHLEQKLSPFCLLWQNMIKGWKKSPEKRMRQGWEVRTHFFDNYVAGIQFGSFTMYRLKVNQIMPPFPFPHSLIIILKHTASPNKYLHLLGKCWREAE